MDLIDTADIAADLRPWGYCAVLIGASGYVWRTSRPSRRKSDADACARDWNRIYSGEDGLRSEVRNLYVQIRRTEPGQNENNHPPLISVVRAGDTLRAGIKQPHAPTVRWVGIGPEGAAVCSACGNPPMNQRK